MHGKPVFLVLSLAAGLAQAADPITVQIGYAGPTSGPQAAIGQDAANAVRMAVGELNHRNLSIGGAPVTWKALIEDDQGDPKQATSVAQRFVDSRVNGVVGHLNSGCTYPASRIYERGGIPDITPSSTDPKIAKQGFKTFFRIIANDTALGAALAKHARNVLKAQKVAVIDDRTAYGQGLADEFALRARALGMQVVDREYTTDKATDFSAILTKIRGSTPDVIFFGGVYPQGGPMLRQIERLGLKTHFMGGDAICVPSLATLAGEAVDMTICAEGGSPLAQMPGGPAWKARYDAAFGSAAYQIFSPYAYDATMVLAQAMLKAQSVDPAKYTASIRDIDYDGVTKQHIRFLADGNLAAPGVTLSGFEHGVKKVISVENVD
jgi:branched-chain amino acid transport system substrate-binding protein